MGGFSNVMDNSGRLRDDFWKSLSMYVLHAFSRSKVVSSEKLGDFDFFFWTEFLLVATEQQVCFSKWYLHLQDFLHQLHFIDLFMPDKVCCFAEFFRTTWTVFSFSFSSLLNHPLWRFNNTSFFVNSFRQPMQTKFFTSPPPFLQRSECLCLLCLCLKTTSQKLHLNSWFSLFISTVFTLITL